MAAVKKSHPSSRHNSSATGAHTTRSKSVHKKKSAANRSRPSMKIGVDTSTTFTGRPTAASKKKAAPKATTPKKKAAPKRTATKKTVASKKKAAPKKSTDVDILIPGFSPEDRRRRAQRRQRNKAMRDTFNDRIREYQTWIAEKYRAEAAGDADAVRDAEEHIRLLDAQGETAYAK